MEDSASAGKRLTGHDLPKLYELLTGRPFGISNPPNGSKIMNTTGVKFVRLCMAALGLEPFAPATIAEYWKELK